MLIEPVKILIPAMDIIPDEIQTLLAQIAELKEMVEKREASLTIMTTENTALKMALQLCKQNMSPEPIILPTETKKTGESCNTRYIIEQLNAYKNPEIPTFDEYFKNGNDYVQFDFSSVTDLIMFDTHHVINELVNYVKNNVTQLPIKFHKSSWYVKEDNGWIKEQIISDNKGIAPNNIKYQHQRIVSTLLFIYQTRFIRHFDKLLGERWRCLGESQFPRIISEVLDRVNYRNSIILLPLAACFGSD